MGNCLKGQIILRFTYESINENQYDAEHWQAHSCTTRHMFFTLYARCFYDGNYT